MKITFNRDEPSGNIFWIMGQAYAELSAVGKKDEAQTMCHRAYNAGSYDKALDVIREYVDLEEVQE